MKIVSLNFNRGSFRVSRLILSLAVLGFQSLGFAEGLQSVLFDPRDDTISSFGKTFTLIYEHSGGESDPSGIGVRVHFDSLKVEAPNYDLLHTNYFLSSAVQDDYGDFDGDPTTDRFLNLAWVSFSGGFANEVPLELATISFQPRESLPDGEVVQLAITSSSTAAGYAFSGDFLLLNYREYFDTDGDGLWDVCPDACLAKGFEEDFDDDNDGLSDLEEEAFGSDIKLVDTDDDGLTDKEEFDLGSNPSNQDTDGDGTNDPADQFPTDAAEQADSDGDGVGDNADTDDDNDGVFDTDDAYPLTSLDGRDDVDGDGIPNTCDEACLNLGMMADTDNDNDGLPNDWEQSVGLDPLSPFDAWQDPDEDGTLSRNEYVDGTDPLVADVSPAQVVYAQELVKPMFNRSLSVPFYYRTTDGNSALTGLGLKVHYDSTLIDSIAVTPFSSDLLGTSDGVDSNDLDDDPSTDRVLNIGWVNFSGTGWPGEQNIELLTLDVTFKDFAEEKEQWVVPVRFSGDPAEGYVLSASSVHYVFGLLIDTDGDGLLDECPEACLLEGYEEDPDDDNDGQADVDELACGSDPLDAQTLAADNDLDDIPDCVDPDDDNDGLLDIEEDINADGIIDAGETNPLSADTDGDGINDGPGLEGVDPADAFPLDPAASVDTDDDGLPDDYNVDASAESLSATELIIDFDDDNDGQTDFDELACGSDPLDAQSLATDTDLDDIPNCIDPDDDNDGLLDTEEDINADGIIDTGETNPLGADTDGDGVNDGPGLEGVDLVDAFPLDPAASVDTDDDGLPDDYNVDATEESLSATALIIDLDDDNDGLSDEEELATGTDPKNADTDGDGVDDSADPYPVDPELNSHLIEDVIDRVSDFQLRTCLENREGFWWSNSGVSTPSDAVQVSEVLSLHCNPPVASLAGLENFTYLQEISIDHNFLDPETKTIRGLKPEDFPGRNSFTDLAPLSYLTNLSHLVLVDSLVADLSPLSELTGLIQLGLNNERDRKGLVDDLSPLSKLNNLTVLSLPNHQIQDVSPMANMMALQEFNLLGNQVRSFENFPQVGGLGWAWVALNPIENYGRLVDIPITFLAASVDSAADYEFVQNKESVMLILMSENPVQSFDFLDGKSVEFLYCVDCGLDDSSRLDEFVEKSSQLPRLWGLGAIAENIRDVRPFTQVTFQGSPYSDPYENHGILALNQNDITDVAPLRDGPLAISISLDDNPVLCSQLFGVLYSSNCLSDDGDEDGDGVINVEDAFPSIVTESSDFDGDYLGDNEDLDDDNDGLNDVDEPELGTDPFNADTDEDGALDSFDALPLDASEQFDTDEDGVGNNADDDDDGDGVLDAEDAYPLISLDGRSDTDGDGLPDACDPGCLSVGMMADSDNDNDGLPNDWEQSVGLDPLSPFDAWQDPDEDGTLSRNEYVDGTDPLVADVSPAQVVYAQELVKPMFNRSLSVPFYYRTTDGNSALTGLGLKVHYDSMLIDSIAVAPFSSDLLGTSDEVDSNDLDDDPLTDRVLNIGWVNFSGTGWPGEQNIELLTLDVTFKDFAEEKEQWVVPVRFSGEPAEGYVLSASSVHYVFGLLIDTDGDGLLDECPEACLLEGYEEDFDDDNDLVLDVDDVFPKDPSESLDFDGDGIGDNADPDDDGDNYEDFIDAFPFDAAEWLDTDEDGLGNNADLDDDNDDYPDDSDAFPLEPSEWLDTDGDGLGDNADEDDDNDNYPDDSDAFPRDGTEWLDTDEDGTGDNADSDDDGDGYDDQSDAFPLDSSEWADTDEDGIGNNSDLDDDADGQLDQDELACGSDPLNGLSLALDFDQDSLPDCIDVDDDNDQTVDDEDAFPLNPLYQFDDDNDGMPNGWEEDFGFDAANDSDANLDPDEDGYSNLEEFTLGTDPLESQGKAQVVYAQEPVYMIPGIERALPIFYRTSDNNPQLSGLGIRIHFSSQEVESIAFDEASVLKISLLNKDTVPQLDVGDWDGDPNTDQYLLAAWVDIGGEGWPLETPVKLFDLKITASEGALESERLTVRFSATDFAAGYRFVSKDVINPVLGASMDVDGDGEVRALTDGLMIIRYLFRFSGDLLTVNALGPNAVVTDPTLIATRIEAFKPALDVDLDGDVRALTDGLMVIRRLFRFSGSLLTINALGPAATRTDSEEISAYIDAISQ